MAYRINPFTGNLDLVSFETVLAPLVINTNQILTLPQSNTTTSGYLSAADWNLFNGKQNLLTAGTNITITTVGGFTYISSTGGGGGGSYIPLANGGIDIDATTNPNTISTIYDTAIGGSVMSIPVGGAGSLPASTWKTKTIVQALDAILFPLALPTYTVTSISLTGGASTLVEVGTIVNQSLNLYAYKNDAGIYTQLELFRGILPINTVTTPPSTVIANIPPQFGYADPNNPNLQYLQSYTDSGVTILNQTVYWSGTGNYNAGSPKQDNFGAIDTRTPAVRNPNAPQAAEAGFTSNSVSVTGIYPYYVYKSASPITAVGMQTAIATGLATGYLAYSTGTIVIPAPTATGQYVAVAYPATSPTKTIWYVNITNNSTIPGGVFGAATTLSCNSPGYPAISPLGGVWQNVPYKIHVTPGLLTELSQMELRN